MKFCNRFIALALAAALLVLGGCQKGGDTAVHLVSSTRYIGQARGFFITTGSGGDFPSPAAVTLEQQQQELAAMVQFASDHKLNSIFFEARPGATAFYQTKLYPADSAIARGEKETLDPLGYLCQEADKHEVQVFAVLNPFAMGGSLPQGAQNPFAELPTGGDWLEPGNEALHSQTAKGAAELAKKYDLAGVVLEGMDMAFTQDAEASAWVEQLANTVSKAVKRADSTTAVAVAFDATNEHNAMTVATAQRLAQSGAVNMVIPQMNTPLEYQGDTGYLPLLGAWSAAELGTAELYTGNRYLEEDPYQLQNQLLANAMDGGTAGAILGPYSWLAANGAGENELLVSLLAAGKSPPVAEALSFPQTLAITYPQDGATLYTENLYLMGTSDPGKPLTLLGKEITRAGTQGAFGVLVPLAKGSNTITLLQGSESVTVTVKRSSPPTAATGPIKQITTPTLFPTTSLGLDSNENLEIVCVGPAGAAITATLGGQTAVLTQSEKSSVAGGPVTFKGTLPLGAGRYDPDKVTNLGSVTYVVSYKGEHTVQSSVGETFLAGKNVPLTLEVPQECYVASVLTDLKSDDNFTQSLKAGARATIVGRAKAYRNGNPVIAYKLSSGGYLLGLKANIVTDAASCRADITEITKTQGPDWEQMAFRGGQPGVLATQTADSLTLRLLDTKLTADPQALVGGLVQAVERTDTKDGVELKLTFSPGSLWGYDITHGEGATTLYLRRTPQKSAVYGKPLDGISILLDPGHGGSDPGALGIAGTTGPTEAVLNMAVANATKFRLEQLGAQVSLTRADESVRVTLDQRTFQAQKERPHLFLSIHHNSALLEKDLNEVHHMEAYYWEGAAKPLADTLMAQLTHTLGREPTDPENAYYYVTRLTFAPAVLFEMGFVVNPVEYEDACSSASHYKAANGIAMAVTDLVCAG